MRRNDGHHDADRAARDPHVEQDAHHRHSDAVSNRQGMAKRRPDKLCARCKQPDRRSERPDKKHSGVVQCRAERAGAETRHEVGRTESEGAGEFVKGGDHASFAPWSFCEVRGVVVELASGLFPGDTPVTRGFSHASSEPQLLP